MGSYVKSKPLPVFVFFRAYQENIRYKLAQIDCHLKHPKSTALIE